jgi:tRNA A37 threonylcarbamoyladenosine synthetase subunit TsaC/SUA5/YrdC
MADSDSSILDWNDCPPAVCAAFRAQVLAGDIFVLPTETVYGLA